MSLPVTYLADGTAQYVTRDGDFLDHVAYQFYGTHIGTTELLYEANQNLSRQPLALPAGVLITLPKFKAPEPPTRIRLWD